MVALNTSCYSVEQVIGFPTEPLVTTVVLNGGLADCTCCAGPPPPPEPVPFVRTIQEPVKDFTRVVVSDCDIQVNQKFAENYYRLFKQLKYGMENCCKGVDMEWLWLQKEISDYSMLKIPGACTPPTTVTPVDCPISPIVD
jgi:hypothetical protein